MSKALEPRTPNQASQSPATKEKGVPLAAIATMIVEMIPGGLGPWGVGDLITALEAVAGRTLDGLRLSPSERVIYLGASAIPLVPARPIIAGYRMLRNSSNKK
jgi:hypothetical protein